MQIFYIYLYLCTTFIQTNRLILIVQVKHNLEEEVDNMEMEIVKLRAQLERDSDFEDTKILAEENVAEDEAWCENILSVADVTQDRLSDLSQKSACHSNQKTYFLQEHMHGSLELQNVGSDWLLQHEVDRHISETCAETLTLEPSCIVSNVPPADNDVILCRSFSAANETVVSEQSAHLLTTQQGDVSDSVQEEELATCTAEDWPELSANTMKMFKGVALPHVTTERQSVGENTLTGCVSLMDDDGDGSACASKQGPADVSIGVGTQALKSSFGDNDCSVSAIPLVDVCEDELTANTSCIQLAHTGSLDHGTVSAIPDSLDDILAVCDAADDTNSCVSCEEIVIPDSEDDLFCSPHNSHTDHTALMSHHDESKHVDKTVTVSDISTDVPVQADTVDGFTVLMKTDDSSVDSLAENVKQEPKRSEENKNSNSISQCNRVPCQINHICMSDTDSDAIIKHADCLAEESHLSSINETFDGAFELCQPPSLSVIQQQLPKRPHWTLVVSGISQALDQVILPSIDSR